MDSVDANILVKVDNLKKTFFVKSQTGKKLRLRAVDGVSFDVRRGETFGLVGESGCGKSTLGRTILGLYQPDAGSKVIFDGQDVTKIDQSARRDFALKAQLIFQDPAACLNPRRTVRQILEQPLRIHNICSGREIKDRVHELVEMVGLADYHLDRYPHEVSGGQKQRIGIARALSVNPKLIVCDEPVSALDVSIQAQVINLLEDLQDKLGLAYLFISHDLSVVHHTSNRVGVMYLGKMVELAERDDIYENTRHPYTQALISSIPSMDPMDGGQRIVLTGDVPNPSSPPSGCRFHTRCAHATEICRQAEPELIEVMPGHFVACHIQTAKKSVDSSEITVN